MCITGFLLQQISDDISTICSRGTVSTIPGRSVSFHSVLPAFGFGEVLIGATIAVVDQGWP